MSKIRKTGSNHILSDLIRLGRQRGMTQAVLAEKVGIHPASLSRSVSTGRFQFETVEKIARFLGMKVIVVSDNDLAEDLARGEVF